MYYVIVNQTAKSGNGGKCYKKLQHVMKDNDISYKAFRTKGKGDAYKVARKLSLLPDKLINLIVIGGDGTINEVINGIVDFSKIRLAIIPAGSGNDFARGLGIKNINASILSIFSSNPDGDIYCDVGRVQTDEGLDRRFVISSGIGLDAIVCKKTNESKLKKTLNKIGMGNFTYIIHTVQTLFSMKKTKCLVCMDDEIPVIYDNMIFAAAMNLSSEGGGVKMAPRAKANDGQLHMCMAHSIAKCFTFFALPFLAVGKHEKFPFFYTRDFNKCFILVSKPLILHADGEYCGEAKRVKYTCERGKLRVVKNF